MKHYEVYVVETVVQRVRYVVKAKSKKEADKMALAQNPDNAEDNEDIIKFSGVVNTIKQLDAKVESTNAISAFAWDDHRQWG